MCGCIVDFELALGEEVDLFVELVEESSLGEGHGSSADGLQHGYE